MGRTAQDIYNNLAPGTEAANLPTPTYEEIRGRMRRIRALEKHGQQKKQEREAVRETYGVADQATRSLDETERFFDGNVPTNELGEQQASPGTAETSAGADEIGSGFTTDHPDGAAATSQEPGTEESRIGGFRLP